MSFLLDFELFKLKTDFWLLTLQGIELETVKSAHKRRLERLKALQANFKLLKAEKDTLVDYKE